LRKQMRDIDPGRCEHPLVLSDSSTSGAAPAAAVARSGGIAQFERVLASAGVDVAHLFSQYGMRTGQGGPFIPAPRGQQPDTTLSAEKLAALQNMVKVLPVSAPLA